MIKFSFQDDTLEETGWKLVHGDVFRPPPHQMILVNMVGTGIQLLGMVGIIVCKFFLHFFPVQLSCTVVVRLWSRTHYSISGAVSEISFGILSAVSEAFFYQLCVCSLYSILKDYVVHITFALHTCALSHLFWEIEQKSVSEASTFQSSPCWVCFRQRAVVHSCLRPCFFSVLWG